MENVFKKIRNSAGLIQTDVASKLGVAQPTVATWESGASFPRAEMLPKIAKLYGCTVDELLADEHKTT